MGITSQKAIDLLDGISSKEELTALIEQLDTTGNGKSTTMQNDYRTIHSTQAYKFLTSTAFEDKLDDIFDTELEANEYKNGSIGKGGAWDTISKNFAKTTSGDIVALIGESATKDRIWFQTEYPALLNNGNIKTINSINANQYFFSSNIKDDYILDRMKIETMARDAVATKSGKSIVDVTQTEMNEMFKDETFVQKIKQTTLNYDVGDLSNLHSYMGKLGIFGSVLGFTVAAVQVEKAYAAGGAAA